MALHPVTNTGNQLISIRQQGISMGCLIEVLELYFTLEINGSKHVLELPKIVIVVIFDSTGIDIQQVYTSLYQLHQIRFYFFLCRELPLKDFFFDVIFKPRLT